MNVEIKMTNPNASPTGESFLILSKGNQSVTLSAEQVMGLRIALAHILKGQTVNLTPDGKVRF